MGARIGDRRIEHALQHLRAHYEGIAGLRLTAGEAALMLDLDAWIAAEILEALAASQFLDRNGEGAYVRRHRPTGGPPCVF